MKKHVLILGAGCGGRGTAPAAERNDPAREHAAEMEEFGRDSASALVRALIPPLPRLPRTEGR